MSIKFPIIPLAALALLLAVGCSKNGPVSGEENPPPQLLITFQDLFAGDSSGADRVEDFDFNDRYIYVHPTGAYGVFRYDRQSGKLAQLLSYPSGNYIALAGDYLFYEISGSAVYRYDLAAGREDLQLDLSAYDFTNIDGLETRGNELFVFVHGAADTSGKLLRADLDGRVQEVLPYPRKTYYMTIADDIVYAIYYPNQVPRLSRYDLRKRTFLEDLILPTLDWYGIRARDGRFYYADGKAGAIYSLPMTSLQ